MPDTVEALQDELVAAGRPRNAVVRSNALAEGPEDGIFILYELQDGVRLTFYERGRETAGEVHPSEAAVIRMLRRRLLERPAPEPMSPEQRAAVIARMQAKAKVIIENSRRLAAAEKNSDG